MHYLDNASTTQVLPSAADAAVRAMCEVYGNPSSLHQAGCDAEDLVRHARGQVADALGCSPDRVIFTSGGTESDNTAIFGAVRKQYHQGKHIITTAVEHPAVSNAMTLLEKEGFTVTRVAPGEDGCICAADVEAALRNDTILVSVMHVNNETGAVMPIREIGNMLKRRHSKALFHCDGVQAFIKLPTRMESLGVDFYAISGHKVHAPKGIGALYIRQGIHIPPHIVGGGQEGGMRSGTESVPLIAALGEALANTPTDAPQRIATLRQYLFTKLEQMPYVRINYPDSLPCVISLSLPGTRAEVAMRILEAHGVCVSTGSACSKGRRSTVLTACRLPPAVIDGTMRVSLSWTNTQEDMDALLTGLRAAYERLKA